MDPLLSLTFLFINWLAVTSADDLPKPLRLRVPQEGVGQIISPGYPYQTPNDLNKYYLLKDGTTENQIKVAFTQFELQQHVDCIYDFVAFYDGSTKGSSLLGKYCGTQIPPNIYSSGPTMLIHFQTGSTGSSKGFVLRYSIGQRPFLKIVAGVVCALVVLFLLALFLFRKFYYKTYKKRKKERKQKKAASKKQSDLNSLSGSFHNWHIDTPPHNPAAMSSYSYPEYHTQQEDRYLPHRSYRPDHHHQDRISTLPPIPAYHHYNPQFSTAPFRVRHPEAIPNAYTEEPIYQVLDF